MTTNHIKRVIDKEGNVIKGLYRMPDGTLTVRRPHSYAKYLENREKTHHQQDKINNLENEVSELKNMIKMFVENKGNDIR